jgi:hypothetical protein
LPTYPLDADPEQIVRWLVDEHKRSPSAFRISARRTVDVRELPATAKFHLGDEEREDLSEVETVATLEIAPANASDGWLIKVVVDDEVGPRLPDRAASIEGEQQIDLGTFYRRFIKPDRGIATATAEVLNTEAEQRLNRLLESISTNRHAAA